MAEEALIGEAADSPFAGVDQEALLPGADPQTPYEAGAVLAKSPGRLVVWAGTKESGKTTLTTQLYERQRKRRSAYDFAGSRTLLAFERIVHPTRAASGRVAPAIRRTELDPDGREILHLALRKNQRTVNLHFADIPGEIFRQLADNQIDAQDIPLLHRADKLGVLVDGALLCDLSQRPMVVVRIRQLLERLAESGVVDRRTDLAVVVTKWDLVSADQRAIDYWQENESVVIGLVRELDARVLQFRVAAAPRVGVVGDDGVASLREWLVAPNRAIRDPRLPPIERDGDMPPTLVRPRKLAGR